MAILIKNQLLDASLDLTLSTFNNFKKMIMQSISY